MSSNQKNVLLGVLVLIIVGMSVYLSQSRNPQTGTTNSTEPPSEAENKQTSSESTDAAAEISLEQSEDAPEQEITTEETSANTKQSDQEQTTADDKDTQQESDEKDSSSPDPNASSGADEANEKNDQEVPSDTNTYVVQEQDNLRKIADQFYGTVDEWNRILEANSEKLSETGSVEPGMTLTIPKKTSETDAPEESKNTSDSSEEVAGDSQDSDSASTDTGDGSTNDEQDVVEENSQRRDDQTSDPESQSSTEVSYEGEPPFEAGPNQRWYRVQDGDSLWEISVKVYDTGKHFSKIWELNKDRIRGYNDIHPGDWLLLPQNP